MEKFSTDEKELEKSEFLQLFDSENEFNES